MYASGNPQPSLVFALVDILYLLFCIIHESYMHKTQPEKIWGTPSGDVVVGEPGKSLREIQRARIGQVIGHGAGCPKIGGRSFAFFPDLGKKQRLMEKLSMMW